MKISEWRIQEQFITEQLDKHGEMMIDEFIENIAKRNLIDKDNLRQSLSKKVTGSTLQVSFLTYGRMHDLKSKNESQIFETPDTNKLIWGVKQKRKRKRNKKWYSKTAYGITNRAFVNIMYGLSDLERERIKQSISNPKTTIQL